MGMLAIPNLFMLGQDSLLKITHTLIKQKMKKDFGVFDDYDGIE